ncbi:MAG: orotidine 5'-phosphate decarboxylase [Afipia sp.]|nr:orotidine 5'-phosphate decarboxylase [Afipia sp.]
MIPALDVDSIDDMLRLVEKTANVPGIAGYKLGLTGTLPNGLPAAILALRKITDLPVIYDHQKAGPDMPDMAQKFAKLCKGAGANALILFPVAGPQAVRSFVGETVRQGLIPVVGGHIPVPDYCISGGGFMIDDVLERIMAIANEAGAHHFVLPANDAEAIRRHVDWMARTVNNPVAFLTGFGTLGGDVGTAFRAASACLVKFAIVGRAVSTNKSPGDAARKFIEEMMRVA